MALALALLMRPVGRYLIVPFGVLFLLGTRSWVRTVVVGVSFGVLLVVSLIFNQIVFDQFELNGGGTFMLSRPLTKSGLLEADNGPASARVVDLQIACPEGKGRNRCFLEVVGSWPEVRKLHADAYQEMLKEHSTEFAELVADEFTAFLRLPGLQYRGGETPSDVQCADVNAKTERDTEKYVEQDMLLYGASDSTMINCAPSFTMLRRQCAPLGE